MAIKELEKFMKKVLLILSMLLTSITVQAQYVTDSFNAKATMKLFIPKYKASWGYLVSSWACTNSCVADSPFLLNPTSKASAVLRCGLNVNGETVILAEEDLTKTPCYNHAENGPMPSVAKKEITGPREWQPAINITSFASEISKTPIYNALSK